MNIRFIAIALYIMLIYWLSLQIPFLDTLFFPTLGAFSFLFVSRSFRYKEIGKVVFGAVVSSIVGTALYFVYPSPVTLLANMLITIWLVVKFKWNAPPIVAVSLIPFFSDSSYHWFIPLSVCAALIGLLAVLFAAEQAEKAWKSFPFIWGRNKAVEPDNSI